MNMSLEKPKRGHVVRDRLKRVNQLSARFDSAYLPPLKEDIAEHGPYTDDIPKDTLNAPVDIFVGQAAEMRAITALLIENMWKEIHEAFSSTRNAYIRRQFVDRHIEGGSSLADAIYAAEEDFFSQLSQQMRGSFVMEQEPAYRRLQSLLHAYEFDKTITPETLIVRGITNGLQVIVGLAEILPTLYSKAFENPPNKEELKKLLSVETLWPLLEVWSSMKGEIVQHFERLACSGVRNRRAIGIVEHRFHFNSEYFELVQEGGCLVVVPTEGFLDAVKFRPPIQPSNSLRLRCPARSAEGAKGKGDMLYEYTQEVVELFHYAIAS